MAKQRALLIGLVVLVLLVFAAVAFAQTGDSDGDGVSNRIDRCPTVPGPPENSGCPLPDSGGIPDKDGDGVADYVDHCPDQAGTGFTEGCPVDTSPDTPPDSAADNPPAAPAVMIWDSTTECRVGVSPALGTSVNIREQPTTSATIIGQLLPGEQFEPFFHDYDENNAIWFGGAHAGDSWGWVAGRVTIDNGQCASLPLIVHVDAPGALHDLILPPNFDLFDPNAGDATPAPPSAIVWDTLPDSFAVLVEDSEGGSSDQGGSPTERRTGGSNPYMIITLKEVIITGVSPGSSGGGDLPPQPPPQPSPAPSPARPLPVLLVIADMYDTDCAAISGDGCLLMALRLPEFGDEPGQCSDASGEQKRRLSRLLEAALKGKVFKKVEIHGTARSAESAPQVMVTIDGDGSVVPVEQTDTSANWNYACAVIGFAPDGTSEAMGDGSVRVGVETFVLLPPA